jgi:hypothetical protein
MKKEQSAFSDQLCVSNVSDHPAHHLWVVACGSKTARKVLMH